MIVETATAAAPRQHPDVFTADEAAAFLRLPNPTTLDWLREKGHLVGHQIGKAFMYHRADLDACALSMFGKAPAAGPAGGGGAVGRGERRAAMRLAGGPR